MIAGGQELTWTEWAIKLATPAGGLSLLVLAVSKLWPIISSRLTNVSQKTTLESAGIGGATDVVTLMRTQIADMRQQLSDNQVKLKEMEETLIKFQQEKDDAVKAAQQAQSNLFLSGLRITRLEAQLANLGKKPVD